MAKAKPKAPPVVEDTDRPVIEVRSVTAVLEVTPAAAAKWEAA